MGKIKLRHTQVRDANRFYDILNNPNFIFLSAKPKSIKEEKEYLRKTKEKRKANFEYSFTIIHEGNVVGGIGIKINQHRKYIGEIGYFIDENYHGLGIATKAVKILENFGFTKLELKRIEILMNPRNKASIKVALKSGYLKEGILKKALENNGKFEDAIIYAKINND
ncbi:MAG: GNAT family N-acetyltransferase [Candidatus Aenigmarchaeota archaeon]|nr:GNAT family N-acetyltransferase [Candidatus Aenigmarchaeota archaeon]